MSSTIALILCTGLVVFLWRIERRYAPAISRAVWIPTIWVMYCACKPLAVWLGAGGDGSVQTGSSLDRNFLIVLIAMAVAVLMRRRLDWQSIRRDNSWLVVIAVFAFVSILWSDFPFVSIKRYIRFIGSPIMALVLISEASPGMALESVLRRTVWALVPYSLLLIKYYPSLGVMYGKISGGLMWVGVATQKNSLGILCMVAFFFLFWSTLRQWNEGRKQAPKLKTYGDIGIGLLALYLLRGPSNAAASKTSFVVLALGCLGLLALLWMKNRRSYLPRGAFITAVVVAFAYGFGVLFGLTSLFAVVLEALGRDTTFTGRTEIWEELVPIAMQSPFLGCGYGGFWVLPVESGVNEAHNGYLDVLIELGAVGLLLVFGFVVSMCKAAYAALARDFWWAAFAWCFLLMAVLHNASESTYLKTSDFLWTVLLSLSVIVHSRAGKAQKVVVVQATEGLRGTANAS